MHDSATVVPAASLPDASAGKDAVQLLRQVPIFSHVQPQDLERLARSCRRVYASRKQPLFRQGDPCDGFHVIVYGMIKMSLTSWKRADKPVQLIGQGGCFGDITMFSGQQYFLNVQALEDSLFLYVPRAAIVQLIEHDSAFAMQLLASLSERVKGMMGDIESFSLQPPAARLVSYLMRLLPANCSKSARIDLSISKNVVAAHLNLTPETLSRYFRELTESGLVTVEGRCVTVHDVDALGRYMDRHCQRGQG